MDSYTTVLTFIFWFLTGTACAYFAYQRGRDPYFWFAIGLFFGLLGLLVLMFLPVITSEEASKKEFADVQAVPQIPPVHENDYMIKDWFWIDKTGQQQGPIRYEILKTLWNENKVDALSFVWSEGMESWKRIEELPALNQGLEATT